MKSFLLVLESDRSRFDAMSREEQVAQIGRYNEWVGGLVERDRFENGLGLQKGHYVLSPGDEVSVEGPIEGPGEVLTGMFQVKAEDYQDALAIAKTCPALECGERVLVFQLGGAG